MLDEEHFAQWLDRLAFVPSTRMCIADIRQSEPVRKVSGRYGNATGRYPSRKMGKTLQFESHTVELWAIYAMEHDPFVLEFYDQPNRIKIQYRGSSGKRVTNWHPPDFFILRQDGASWEEWKPEQALVKLVESHPDRYERTPSGGYRCPPGEAYAKKMGLTYRVRSSAEFPVFSIQNLMFLEDYWITPLEVPPSIADQICAVVQAEPGIRLAALLSLTPDARPNAIYALLAQERLYVDWAAAPLGDHATVRLYPDAESIPLPSSQKGTVSGSLVQTAVYWDGQAYLIRSRTDQGVDLQAEYGDPFTLSNDLFTHFLRDGAIRILSAADPQPVRPEMRHHLSQASPQSLAIAQERMVAVQSYLHNEPTGYHQVASRTLRRWVQDFHAAEAQYGSGFIGLIPHISARGNRNPRADLLSHQLMDQIIQERYTDVRRRNSADMYMTYQSSCATRGVQPLSQRTFRARVKQLATPELKEQRLGLRAAYAESGPYWTLEPTTPRHGDRPFAIAHLDHTLLDIEVVSQTGRNLGRPWATFLMDAYSRRFLAVYLTFDPPSYRSCMMALRICVRQHRRFPQSIVVDGGKDFESQYFDQLLARYYCIKKVRPLIKPRFGSVLERLFGTTNTQFLSHLQGNTQITKTPRQITSRVNPRNTAVWTLPALSDFLCEWAYDVYDQTDHPALGETPRAFFLQGLAQTGERSQRFIAYDDVFIKATMPTTAKGTVTIRTGKGIQLFGHYYWNDVFDSPMLAKSVVPVRYDPFDIGQAYVFVDDHWLECQSTFYAQLQGRSERELQLVTDELKQQQRENPERQRATMERVVAFWERAENHEKILIQRIKDQESASMRGTHEKQTAALVPKIQRTATQHKQSVNLDELPKFGEYK